MVEKGHQTTQAKPMSQKDFRRLSEFIYSHCGIKMPPIKKIMLEARLQKRLRFLGISTFREYCDYLFDAKDGSGELVHMINAVTTNKTDFFREPGHFDFLAQTVLPEYARQCGTLYDKPFTVWSAGCSSGEEPYTLAMTLRECTLRYPGFRFSILATDISTKVLETAKQGIYEEERIETVPPGLKRKYLRISKDRSKRLVRVVPDLRALVRFERLNLMDSHVMISEPVDVIFCRNVLIYFDRATQERLLEKMCRYLRPGGYLFLGHSETVHGFDLSLERVSATIYRKVL